MFLQPFSADGPVFCQVVLLHVNVHNKDGGAHAASGCPCEKVSVDISFCLFAQMTGF